MARPLESKFPILQAKSLVIPPKLRLRKILNTIPLTSPEAASDNLPEAASSFSGPKKSVTASGKRA
jgi:hypothetical protein